MRVISSLAAALVVLLAGGCTPSSSAGSRSRPTCGDGHVDAGEACDGGEANGDTPGSCRGDCSLPRCGDGIVDPGEGCDPGDDGAPRPGTCREDCSLPRCGDGVVDPGEGCDDGPENSDLLPGACRTACEPASCGDGVADADEACDEGPANSDVAPDACRATCVLPRCGDYTTDASEACDDGEANGDAPGACRAGCLLPRCGDGIVDPGEGCDDGDSLPTEGCDSLCQPITCGDGTLDPEEECDDGNALDGDGCSWSCRLELPASCHDIPVIDLFHDGIPDGEGAFRHAGSTARGSAGQPTLSCGGGGDALILAYPVRSTGDLVVEVTPVGNFDARIAVRRSCAERQSEVACAPFGLEAAPGEKRVILVPGVGPEDGVLWVLVSATLSQRSGDFEARVAVVPALPPGETCRTDLSLGRCGPQHGCADADGDGVGTCVPLAEPGGPCNSASPCPGGFECTGTAATTCNPICGNRRLDPGERCDSAELFCTDTCEFRGETCAAPYPIELGGLRSASWTIDFGRYTDVYTASCGNNEAWKDAVASFVAPEDGRYGFHLESGADLWLWEDACGPAAPEAGCDVYRAHDPELAVDLAAGQTVFAVAEHLGRTPTETLTVARTVCGDGLLEPGEVCDDANVVSGDNCAADCTRGGGGSCEDPWRLTGTAARWIGKVRDFASTTNDGSCSTSPQREGVSEFVAPAAGTYTFRVVPSRSEAICGLHLRTACPDPASEVACQSSRYGGSPTLVRPMAAGERIYVFVESEQGFELRIDRTGD